MTLANLLENRTANSTTLTTPTTPWFYICYTRMEGVTTDLSVVGVVLSFEIYPAIILDDNSPNDQTSALLLLPLTQVGKQLNKYNPQQVPQP